MSMKRFHKTRAALLCAAMLACGAPAAVHAQQFIITGSDGVASPGSQALLAAIRDRNWSGYANVEASARELYAMANSRGWDAQTMYLALVGSRLTPEQANRLGNEYNLAGKATGPFGAASSFAAPPPVNYGAAPSPFTVGPGPAPFSVGPGPSPFTAGPGPAVAAPGVGGAKAPACADAGFFAGPDGGVYSASGQRVRVVAGLPPSMSPVPSPVGLAPSRPTPTGSFTLGPGGAPVFDPATRTYGSGSLDEVARGVRQEQIQVDPHYSALTRDEIATYVNGGPLPDFVTKGIPYYLLDSKYGLASPAEAAANRANEVARFGPRGIMLYSPAWQSAPAQPAPSTGGFVVGPSIGPGPSPAASGFVVGPSIGPGPSPAASGFVVGPSIGPGPSPAASGFVVGPSVGPAASPEPARPRIGVSQRYGTMVE